MSPSKIPQAASFRFYGKGNFERLKATTLLLDHVESYRRFRPPCEIIKSAEWTGLIEVCAVLEVLGVGMGAGASGKQMHPIFTFTSLPKQTKFLLRAISSVGALRMTMGKLWYTEISWLPFLSSKHVKIYPQTSNSVFGWRVDKNEATVLPKFGSQVLWCK